MILLDRPDPFTEAFGAMWEKCPVRGDRPGGAATDLGRVDESREREPNR